MKNYSALTLAATAGGVAAFLLRLGQRITGFSPDTGLAIPGGVFAPALYLLLASMTAVFFLMARRPPSHHPDPRPFVDVFSIQGTLPPLASGCLLLILSGGLEVFSVLTGESTTGAAHFSALLSGALTALCGVSLLPAIRSAAAGRHGAARKAAPAALLLVPPVVLVFRTTLTYRALSAVPPLSAYAPDIVALSLAALAFFHLSAFAHGDGSTRAFSFLSAAAAVFCAAALADARCAADGCFYAGCVLLFLGFLGALWALPAKLRHSVAQEEALL